MVCTKYLPSVALGTSGFSLCGYTTHFTLVPVFSSYLHIISMKIAWLAILTRLTTQFSSPNSISGVSVLILAIRKFWYTYMPVWSTRRAYRINHWVLIVCHTNNTHIISFLLASSHWSILFHFSLVHSVIADFLFLKN